MADQQQIQSLSKENRRFPPSSDFTNNAELNQDAYQALLKQAKEDPDRFWGELAKEELLWKTPFQKTIEGTAPFFKWFSQGTLNASAQCLDRHQNTETWKKRAMVWESEAGEVREYTYAQVFEKVCQVANALEQMGATSQDVVTIYMPLIPEALFAMLACARIGAAHSVVFAGFSSEALADRIIDAKSRFVITADGGVRKGQIHPLKENVDLACKKATSVKHVLIYPHCQRKILLEAERDLLWQDIVPQQPKTHSYKNFDSEHLLFVLYTSGTTGKPKGIMHSTAGFLLWTKVTTRWVFDLKPQDLYWCTADVGWVTGHSYLLYGPLQNGGSIFLYEGAPNTPDWGRFWKMIEKHKINILYTAPTAIRAFMAQGEKIPNTYDLSSLRVLGSVGEPINPEAWMWYHRVIGKEKLPIVDTWWQTETGGIMMSPLASITATKPGSCTLPLPGIIATVRKKTGECVASNEGGLLVIEKPWPSMARGILNDPERFQKTYWTDFPGCYFTGDGARRDEDNYFWVMGRVDDVINVSGHRLGTAEIESALVSHPFVAEAAVVGRPDALKGQGIVAFVILKKEAMETLAETSQNPQSESEKKRDDTIQKLKDHVVKEIGALARPDDIRLTTQLPKTRSGKIMRRLLREIATNGVARGDTTTLEDEKSLEQLMSHEGDEET